MNPWHWNRVHQVAWIVSSAIGALVGLMLAFTHSPLFFVSQTLHTFVVWISLPKLYWQMRVYLEGTPKWVGIAEPWKG
jgi:predicted branched-subunit amino acid permease